MRTGQELPVSERARWLKGALCMGHGIRDKRVGVEGGAHFVKKKTSVRFRANLSKQHNNSHGISAGFGHRLYSTLRWLYSGLSTVHDTEGNQELKANARMSSFVSLDFDFLSEKGPNAPCRTALPREHFPPTDTPAPYKVLPLPRHPSLNEPCPVP